MKGSADIAYVIQSAESSIGYVNESAESSSQRHRPDRERERERERGCEERGQVMGVWRVGREEKVGEEKMRGAGLEELSRER